MPNVETESHVPISEWISLEEGKLYPMRASHKEGTGSDHFTLGLEYEEADSSASYNANRQIQMFEISHDNVEEEWTVTVTNPDSGSYTLLFVNNEGESTETWTSDAISTSASAWDFQRVVDEWFWSVKRTGISTTRVGYNDQDVEETDSELIVKYVYTTKALRRFSGQSFNRVVATLSDSSSTVEANAPHVLSSAPLAGKFRITCTDYNGNEHSTEDIAYNNWNTGIEY